MINWYLEEGIRMQVSSLSQFSSLYGTRNISLTENYESLSLSLNDITVQYSESGDTITLTQTNTSLNMESTYTDERTTGNTVTPTTEGTVTSETSPEEGVSGSGLFSEALEQYLEIIRERVKYLLEEAARMSSENADKLKNNSASDKNSQNGSAIVINSTSSIYSIQTSKLMTLSLDSSYFSAENTADRIIQFALSFYDGGDREEYVAMVREAVMKGYNEAKAALGGFLPEVSQRTIDLVNKALDDFAAGTDINISA